MKSDSMIDPAPMAFELLMQTLFDGYCPYTGEQCLDWNCEDCEVEAEEGRWLEELDKEEENA